MDGKAVACHLLAVAVVCCLAFGAGGLTLRGMIILAAVRYTNHLLGRSDPAVITVRLVHLPAHVVPLHRCASAVN